MLIILIILIIISEIILGLLEISIFYNCLFKIAWIMSSVIFINYFNSELPDNDCDEIYFNKKLKLNTPHSNIYIYHFKNKHLIFFIKEVRKLTSKIIILLPSLKFRIIRIILISKDNTGKTRYSSSFFSLILSRFNNNFKRHFIIRPTIIRFIPKYEIRIIFR